MSSAKEPVTRRFGNGLTVLIKEDKSHPVVSLQYWVGTGSMNEGHWQGSGLSHLLEHLVFKGTAHFSGQELARKVQECVHQREPHRVLYRRSCGVMADFPESFDGACIFPHVPGRRDGAGERGRAPGDGHVCG